MTLVELLIAMTLMAIGIAAIVAGLSSGVFAITRAHQTSAAAVIADTQMETFRRGPWSTLNAPTYSTSWSCATGWSVDNATNPPTCDQSVCSPNAASCSAAGSYWALTTIGWTCGNTTGSVSTSLTCNGTPTTNAEKIVSISVRDGSGCTPGGPGSCSGKLLYTETSTFDPSTS